MSNSPKSFKTVDAGLEDGSMDQGLIAICGVGVCDSGSNIRGANGLWENIVESALATSDEENEKTKEEKNQNSESAELGLDARETNNDSNNNQAQTEGIDKLLSEVVYEALQDGAEVSYRGHEALVSCFVTGFGDFALPSEQDASTLSLESKENQAAARRLNQTYDFQGPWYVFF